MKGTTMYDMMLEVGRQRHLEAVARGEANYQRIAASEVAGMGMRGRIALSLVKLATRVQPDMRVEVRRRTITPATA